MGVKPGGRTGVTQNTCGVNFACDRGFAFNESRCHFDSGQRAEREREREREGGEEELRKGEKRRRRNVNEEGKEKWRGG